MTAHDVVQQSVTARMQNTIVIIRSAGERTFSACKALVECDAQDNKIYVVNECPFETALRRCYEIGIESGVDWMVTLDADVLIRDGAISTLLAEAEKSPGHYFQIEGLIHDKLTGLYRNAGHRVYRTKFLHLALQKIPEEGGEIRPEYKTLEAMESLGYPSLVVNTVMGVHDYEQFYRDVYRKAFIHANKHQVWLPQLVQRWKQMAGHDADFTVALRGLYDGLMSLQAVRINARDYVQGATAALEQLGLDEKAPLADTRATSDAVQRILSDGGPVGTDEPASIGEGLRSRLRSRFIRLGFLRGVAYIVGALLTDIGLRIKRFADVGRKP